MPRSSSPPGSTRRAFLGRGAAGAAALWAAARPAAAAAPPAPPKIEARAQSVIQVFLAGGLSHIDSFDPKPAAPVESRGEFDAIPTALDGERFAEVLAATAAIADRLTVIRSTTHAEAAHERGTHSMLTGYRPSPVVTYPAIGAVVAQQLGVRNDLPPYVCVPTTGAFGYLGTGYLSAAFAPFEPASEPNSRRYRVRDMEPPAGVDAERLARRRALVAAIDASFDGAADPVRAAAAFYDQAWSLIDSAAARQAFEVTGETDAVRDRYGRTDIGQRLLLARRLALAGVRYVVVTDGGYDNHERIFPTLRARLRDFDRGFAALIGDLDERGALDDVLVLVTTEFGRTPKVNRTAGRDHWPRVFSTVLAGGGVRRGYVLGASDPQGAEPDRDPVTPPDLAATVFTLLGIDPTRKLRSPGDRPIDIVRDGRVLDEILAQ